MQACFLCELVFFVLFYMSGHSVFGTQRASFTENKLSHEGIKTETQPRRYILIY